MNSWPVFRSVLAAYSATAVLGACVALAGSPVKLAQPSEAGITLMQPAAYSTTTKASLELWEEPAPEPATASVSSDCGCCDNACSNWCSSDWWTQLDMLVWWTKGNHVPALVTSSPDGTPRAQAGVLGQPGTAVLHGGNGIDDNYRPGVRFGIGHWLDSCQTWGAELVWFSLGDGANTGNYYAQSVGAPLSPILARPFFDVNQGAQNAQLVAFPNIVEGDIQVQTSSELHSLAVLLHRNLRKACGSRVDLVGGYRYLRFREGLTVRENLTSTDPGGAVAVGTLFNVYDDFLTENDFNGGELGLSTVWDRGGWSLDVLAKLAFGNMHQAVRVNGGTVVTAPVGAPAVGNGGLLALPSNMGTVTQNKFAFIPELNANLRYYYSERLSLQMGYSLLWITEVARTGDQIDPYVNTTQLPANGGNLVGPARPAVPMDSTSMWAQGLNLGLIYEF